MGTQGTGRGGVNCPQCTDPVEHCTSSVSRKEDVKKETGYVWVVVKLFNILYSVLKLDMYRKV